VARPDGRPVWVNFAHPDNDVVQVIDVPSRTVIHSFKPGRAVLHMEFTPRGEEVWISVRDADRVEIYDTATFAKVADAIAAGSFVISGIALLAAGVGIMNIMLVSVTERTKEIGIRKSIGARKKSILIQFLLEAVAISLAGGVMGIALGVAGGNGLAVMLNASVIFPWNWAAIGLLVCSGIGVGFGFYPAWKAASLDPIEALRYE
ncbi:MAG: FtsX-like permease family protein, partial [Opitutaceae bacterium]